MSRLSSEPRLQQGDLPKRVQNIWFNYKQDLKRTLISSPNHKSPQYGVNTSTFLPAPQHRQTLLAATQEKRLEETCMRFYHLTQQDDYVVTDFDDLLAMDMECSFVFEEGLTTWLPKNEDQIISDTCHLVERLPPYSSELKCEPQVTSSKWDERPEVLLISTTVVCMGLWLAGADQKKSDVKHGFLGFVNLLATLLQIACRLAEQKSEHQGWHTVIVFLWSTWQRSVLLYLWCIMRTHLLEGFDADNTTPKLALTSLPKYIKSRLVSDASKSDYMCNWAYEVLRNEPGSQALDLRRLHNRFVANFGDKMPRCTEATDTEDSGICDGSSPAACRRFVDSRTPDKQVHDTEHCSCISMFWDFESYNRVQGARAVCIETSKGGRLRYKNATAKTLSISHVWSHGQGGRPDQVVNGKIAGFNTCLHERYTRIAKGLGCDSYWIDAACIPNDPFLRQEAISHINRIFGESHATIVADKDIMSIDVGELGQDKGNSQLAMQVRESILATILVCDWNVRAWTFLESLRGRQKLLLLCRNNQTVDLQETLEIVHTHGSIDISVLFVGTQHLWPFTARWAQLAEQFPSVPVWSRGGYMKVEDAASLLSHRHATRAKDETAIWSLLLGNEVYKTPEELWKSRIGEILNTGYILSSAPRLLNVPGFSWAPTRAAISVIDEEQQQRRQIQQVSQLEAHLMPRSSEPFYLAYHGYDTAYGRVTEAGFRASWLLYSFPGTQSWTQKTLKNVTNILDLHHGKSKTDRENVRRTTHRLKDIASIYLKDSPYGALLRPAGVYADEERSRAPPTYHDIAKGTLLAVCGCDDPSIGSWAWKGVFDWEHDVKLPQFGIEKILLI